MHQQEGSALVWMPESLEQLQQMLERAQLEESETLEAKREIDSTRSVARILAAMANYGGTLLIGVEEDEDHRLTGIAPVDLSVVEGQVAHIVADCIYGALRYRKKELRLPDNPSQGVLVVSVPPSPRAPHMVTVSGENRYRARVGTTTPPMPAGQVDELLRRRQAAEIDRNELVARERGWVRPVELHEISDVPNVIGVFPVVTAGLTVVAKPALPEPDILRRASGGSASTDWLTDHYEQTILAHTDKGTSLVQRTVLHAASHWRVDLDGYLAASPDHGETSENVVELEARYDGTIVLRSQGATWRQGPSNEDDIFRGDWLNEPLVWHRTQILLGVAARIFEAAGYSGPALVGVDLDRLEGARSGAVRYQYPGDYGTVMDLHRLGRDHYRRTEEVPLDFIREDDGLSVTADLLRDLWHALTQRSFGTVDPWTFLD